MSKLLGDAEIRWTETGGTGVGRSHPLRGPLSRVRPAYRHPQRFTAAMADGSTTETVTVGRGTHDAIATVAHDENPASLIDMLRAGAGGAVLTYVPEIGEPDVTLDLLLVEPTRDAVARMGRAPGVLLENELEVRVRRTDGSAFPDWFVASWYGGAPVPILAYLPGTSVELATFARTGTATYHDVDGTLATAAASKLRDAHYELVSGKLTRTVLLERTRTNVAPQPTDFSLWDVVGTPVVTGGQADPTGGTGAFAVDDDSATAAEYVSDVITYTGDGAKAFSLYVKRGTQDLNELAVAATAPAAVIRHKVQLDWSGGGAPVVTTVTGAGTIYPVSRRLRNGFYRVAFSAAGVVATDTNHLRVHPTREGTVADTGTVIVYGAMTEDGAFPSTFHAGTRNDETLSFPVAHGPQALTIYCKLVESGNTLPANNLRVWHLGDATNGAPYLRLRESGGFYQLQHHNGNAEVSSTLTVAPSFGDTFELRAVLNADGSVQLHQSIDGASETSAPASAANALAAAWSAQTLHVGSVGSLNVGFNRFIVPPLPVAGARSMDLMRTRAAA